MTAATAARVGMGFEEFQAAAATQIPVQRVGRPERRRQRHRLLHRRRGRLRLRPGAVRRRRPARLTRPAPANSAARTTVTDRSRPPPTEHAAAAQASTHRSSGQRRASSPAPAAASATASPEALVARGDRVCITGRNEDALKEAVESLGADRAIGVAGKAHDEAHQAVAVARTMEAFGRRRPPRQQRGHQPGLRPDRRTRPGRRPQGLRDQRDLRARLRPADLEGVAEGERRRDRQHRLRRRPRPLALHRRLRHEQGRHGQPHRPARRRDGPRGAGQLHRARPW